MKGRGEPTGSPLPFTAAILRTMVAYLVDMDVLYLLKFTPYEATTLAARPRYINTAAAMELFALAAVF
ncbi:MAG: hypothetical protein PHI98_05575 [Eubacteriales bacterium]|nr:hypothetical protein [Eubacteriales bacterium]